MDARPRPTISGYSLLGSPQGFKTCLLGKGFHTFINDVLFSSPTNVGHHNPPPFGAQRPRWHSFLPSIDVGPPSNPPFFGAQCPYLHTASCLPPFGGKRESWHIVPFLDSNTICNNPSPPLTDIVLFGQGSRIYFLNLRL